MYQILAQNIYFKCLKSAGKKPPKRHSLDMAALHYSNTSKNQNTEFFKCDLFWRIAIYHNSELFLVHVKTDKSHTFIMYLVIFCVSQSLRELSKLRGVRWLKSIFMKNLEWNPWNLKEPTRSSKAKITFICRQNTNDLFQKPFLSRKSH